jgi:hypothetical protein
MDGTMHPATPARLSTSPIIVFDSVNLLRNNGIEAVLNPQKNCIPNQPTPIRIILEMPILGWSFNDSSLLLVVLARETNGG